MKLTRRTYMTNTKHDDCACINTDGSLIYKPSELLNFVAGSGTDNVIEKIFQVVTKMDANPPPPNGWVILPILRKDPRFIVRSCSWNDGKYRSSTEYREESNIVVKAELDKLLSIIGWLDEEVLVSGIRVGMDYRRYVYWEKQIALYVTYDWDKMDNPMKAVWNAQQ